VVATAEESKNFLEREAELVVGLTTASILGCASGVVGSVAAPDSGPIAAAVEATQGHVMRSADGACALVHGMRVQPERACNTLRQLLDAEITDRHILSLALTFFWLFKIISPLFSMFNSGMALEVARSIGGSSIEWSPSKRPDLEGRKFTTRGHACCFSTATAR